MRRRGPNRPRRLAVLLLALAVWVLPAIPAAAEAPEVTAQGAVLWDPADDRLLYEVEGDVPRPMASTTKIMTVLLAVEAGTVDDQVTVSARAAEIGRIPGAASLGLEAGQVLPMRSVLAGLMLRSGNDAAVAVAEHVAGSVDAFVGLMNQRAAELGLAATRFVNASGLTNDPEHRASPRDLARLAEVAMAHPEIAAWAGARRLDPPGLPPMVNRNELLFAYDGATGVKTGYTALAGLCLVASAERDGRTLFAVVLDSDASFGDAAALLDHGFDDFRRVELLAPGERAATYRWSRGSVELVATAPLARTVPADAEAVWRTVLTPGLGLPVVAGQHAGAAQLLLDGEVVLRVPLETAAAVAAPPLTEPAAEVGASLQDALRDFARLHPVDRAV